MRKVKTLIRLLLSNFSWFIDKPKRFKLKNVSDDIIVIANGPSLKETDLNGLEHITKIGMNRIYLSTRNDLKVDVLVVINKLIIEQYKNEICELDIPVITKWEFRKYFPRNKDNIYFVKGTISSLLIKWPNFVLFGHTVTNVALQLALSSKSKSIHIVGMDHNFKAADINDRNREEVRSEDIDLDHFLPNYFPKGSRWETPDLISSEREYLIIKKHSENINKNIYDCTINGNCNVFIKKNWINQKEKMIING